MEIKKLTDNCHLVIDGHGNKLGLALSRDAGIFFTYDCDVYEDFNKLAAAFRERAFFTHIAPVDETVSEIDGYPIKHSSFVNNEIETLFNNEVVTYKMREESSVKFCAGWWILHSDSLSRLALSPKTTTINELSVGPFKNKFDCQAELSRINKEKRERL